MFFILGGCLDAPYVFMPLYICTPPGVYTPPYVPHTPLCICMFSEASACCGGCKGPLTCGTLPLHLPLYGGASPSVAPPTKLLTFLCISRFQGYLVCHMGIFPPVGIQGSVPHLLGVLGGISTWDVHMLILVHFCSSLCLTFLLLL